MRILTLVLEFRGGSHAPRPVDWPQAQAAFAEALQAPDLDYFFFSEDADNVFVARPAGPGACEIRVQIKSKWFLGMIGATALEINFGTLELEDCLYLLKLFFEGNYPVLKALEREMRPR
jgi:hypothetical protein